MGQITATRNLVATKVVRHAGQQGWAVLSLFWLHRPLVGSWKSFTNIAQGCIIGTAAVIWHENLTQYKPQKNALTHRSLGYHMATDIWVNISSGNGLLSADNKQSLEPIMNYHKWSSVASTCGQFHRKCWRYHFIKPLLHIGGFCRRSAAVPKPWMNAVERHKAQTQPWANATKRHWAPIAAVDIRKFWNVQNFHRRAPVKYLSVMERSRASSIVLDCR